MRASEIADILTWARPGGLRAPKFDPVATNVENQPGLTDAAEPRVPTLIIATQEDGPVSWPNWPNATKAVINGVGKWPHIANPMGAADGVNAFLDGLAPGDHDSRTDSLRQ